MAELKTKKTQASVKAFVDGIQDEQQRKDSRALVTMIRKITGEKPKMWGTSIVGFGTYHYEYASGREGDWMLTGFSPRKGTLTLYIMSGFREYATLLRKLGKHKTGKACLYIKRLDDVDLPTLKEMIRRSVNDKRGGSS